MRKTELFRLHELVNADVAKLESLARAFDLKLVDLTDVSISNVDRDNGFLIGNVGRLNYKCHGVSIWYTKDDIGVRITRNYYNSLNDIQKFFLDVMFNSKKKKDVKERRYSFIDIKDVVFFLSTLKAYESVATKEIADTESVTA